MEKERCAPKHSYLGKLVLCPEAQLGPRNFGDDRSSVAQQSEESADPPRMELEKGVGVRLKVALWLGGRWWEVGAGEFELSLHWRPNLAATTTPILNPFSTSVHGGCAASSCCCAKGVLSSPKFRGPICASMHTLVREICGPICASRHTPKISRASLCLEAHAGPLISRAKLCLEVHASKFRGPSCSSRHTLVFGTTKLAWLVWERFALIHSAKMARWHGWPGWPSWPQVNQDPT